MAAVPESSSKAGASSQAKLVDEATARSIFARFSSAGSTIEREDLQSLSMSLGDTLSDDDLKKAFDELDADGNGHVEFEEFYTWLSNPDRKKSGTVSRMLHAQLLLKQVQRSFAAATAGGKTRVAQKPGTVSVSAEVSAGEVPAEGAPLEVRAAMIPVGSTPDSEVPGGSETLLAARLSFGCGDAAKAGEVSGILEALAEATSSDAPPGCGVTAEGFEDDGAVGSRICVYMAGKPARKMLDDLEGLVDGDFDWSSLFSRVEGTLAASKSMKELCQGKLGDVLRTTGIAAAVDIEASKTAMLALSALLSKMAEENMDDDVFGKLLGNFGRMSEATLRLKFDGVWDAALQALGENLDEEEIPEEITGMNVGEVSRQNILSDDSIPKSASKQWATFMENAETISMLELWLFGKIYIRISCKGVQLDFLPSTVNEED